MTIPAGSVYDSEWLEQVLRAAVPKPVVDMMVAKVGITPELCNLRKVLASDLEDVWAARTAKNLMGQQYLEKMTAPIELTSEGERAIRKLLED